MTKQNELDHLLRPYVEELGYECVEVEFKKAGSDWILTVYIDNSEGISLDDCEKVSEVLSPVLDEHDPIEPSYLLEVSSPGIDRPFKTNSDYEKNLGEKIEVKLYRKLNGKKEFEGILESLDKNEIKLKLSSEEILTIPIKDISKATRAIEF